MAEQLAPDLDLVLDFRFSEENNLKKIRSWEKSNGGLSTDGDYLNFSGAFVESMADAVKSAIEDLIARLKHVH